MELLINYSNCEYRFVLLKCYTVRLEKCFWWPQSGDMGSERYCK